MRLDTVRVPDRRRGPDGAFSLSTVTDRHVYHVLSYHIPNLSLLALVFPSLVHHYINLPLPAPNRFLSRLDSLCCHHYSIITNINLTIFRRHDSPPWLLPCMNDFSHHDGLPFHHHHPGTSSYWNLGGEFCPRGGN